MDDVVIAMMIIAIVEKDPHISHRGVQERILMLFKSLTKKTDFAKNSLFFLTCTTSASRWWHHAPLLFFDKFS